ncbi:hypothetical protein, partial [Nocardia cyriacigeorgica]|uniref:hypothetical protein n=1 Tax=Nocardia cyriacigeorgica TaxID=135487 RepID=UPI001E54281E
TSSESADGEPGRGPEQPAPRKPLVTHSPPLSIRPPPTLTPGFAPHAKSATVAGHFGAEPDTR